MYLLIITTLLSFVSVSNTFISRPLINWLNRPNKEEQEVRREISNLRKEQALISISDNFAVHAKLQRRINALEIKLQNHSNERPANTYIFQMALTYGVRILFVGILFCLAIYYRYTPVFVFPEYMDLSPLNSIISYPNEQLGAVSVHFWMLVTNSVARQILK